jgi:hypothetical protein
VWFGVGVSQLFEHHKASMSSATSRIYTITSKQLCRLKERHLILKLPLNFPPLFIHHKSRRVRSSIRFITSLPTEIPRRRNPSMINWTQRHYYQQQKVLLASVVYLSFDFVVYVRRGGGRNLEVSQGIAFSPGRSFSRFTKSLRNFNFFVFSSSSHRIFLI